MSRWRRPADGSPQPGGVSSSFVAGRRASEDDHVIIGLVDTARFRADDPEELVVASLLCPVCLRSAGVDRDLDAHGYDPSVLCHCDECRQSWRVYLTDQQALRLALTAV